MVKKGTNAMPRSPQDRSSGSELHVTVIAAELADVQFDLAAQFVWPGGGIRASI
jgi:hypothetical protein